VVLSSVRPTATPPRIGRVAPSIAPTVQQPVAVAPPPRPAPVYVQQPANAPPPQRRIVIASPSDPDAADALAASLAAEGARVEPTATGYRVVTGPYPDDAGLSAALARLRARGYQGAAVIDATQPQEPNGTPYP